MKKRILIVDDEEKIRRIYKSFIYAVSLKLYDVVETSNATEATNRLIREKIDMVILDIKLAGVDGQVLFDVIKEYDPDLKVLVASGYPVEKQRRMIPTATDYFDKTESPIKLLEAITRNIA